MGLQRLTISLVLLAWSHLASAQSKEKWPKPEIMVAPAYPTAALVRGIETVVRVNVQVSRDGSVARANSLDGPCRYNVPAPEAGVPACNLAREVETHRAIADKRRVEALDETLPEATRKAKFKEFDTEYWLTAQFEVYEAAEVAARQWVFESLPAAAPPNGYPIILTFRFSTGAKASIEVIDPWSVVVTAALYPHGDR
jgi:hypothetical protein